MKTSPNGMIDLVKLLENIDDSYSFDNVDNPILIKDEAFVGDVLIDVHDLLIQLLLEE